MDYARWGFKSSPFEQSSLPASELGSKLLVGRNHELAVLEDSTKRYTQSRRDRFLAAIVSFALLSTIGCGGSGSSSTTPPPPSTPTATLAAGGAATMYVCSPNLGKVQIYSLATTTGAITPQSALTMPTGFSPASVALDPTNGTIYVGGVTTVGGEILAFSAGSTGAATPQRTIDATSYAFSATIPALRVDSSGNLFAATLSRNASIVEYSPTANGAATALRTLTAFNTSMAYIINGIAIDTSGNIYLSVVEGGTNTFGVVLGMGPKASDLGSPTAQVTSPQGMFYSGLAMDSNSNLYTVQEAISTTTPAAIMKVPIVNSTTLAAASTYLTLGSSNATSTTLSGLQRDSVGNFFSETATFTSMSAPLVPTGVAGFGPNTTGIALPGLLVTTNPTSDTTAAFAIK